MDLRKRLAGMLASFVLAAVACSPGGSSPPATATRPAYPADPNSITVVGTENFYADLLHQLGGSRLRVYAFLNDPNTDPHQYESNAGNARVVADSRLVIVNGLGYDSFMDRLLAASPDSSRKVINVQNLLSAPDGGNPHVWYDPTAMPRIATAVAAALAQLDPAGADGFATRAQAFAASLQPLTSKVASIKQRFAGCPIAFTEPVYGYMAEALGLSVKSPEAFMKAVEEGNDPPSQAVAAELDLITRHQVKVLLYNSQTVTKVTAGVKDLALGNGIPVVGVSETEPAAGTYQEWQLDALSRLEAALSR
jgi:zinc/manganese transport system substrate-binding protein